MKNKRPQKSEPTPRQLLKQLRHELLVAEARSAVRLVEARHQMIAIAKDMLPNAAKFARKGRPRLLSTCQKILAEQGRSAAAINAANHGEREPKK